MRRRSTIGEGTVEHMNTERFLLNDPTAKKDMPSESTPRQLNRQAQRSHNRGLSTSDLTFPEEVLETSPTACSVGLLAAGSDGSPKFRSRARVKMAVVYALTSVIPFLVLLYIIHAGVFSGEGMSVIWVSCLALIALAIALLGWKLMKEAWGKLTHAVETIEDLRGESDHLNHALQMKEREDEIDRIPFVVNHLAGIARKQRDELEDYKLELETLNSKIKEADRELQEVRREDGLTALYNLHYFDDRAGQEVARMRRYERDLALAMIEVDSFKEYKESVGTRAADKSLSRVGAVIRRSIRETDLPFRVADDQFAIIFPETAAANATRALERIRVAVEKQRLGRGISHPNGALTLSIGVSMVGKDCEDLKEFVFAAEKALQKAKSVGGNQVVVLSPE
jgi:diguanylate cyclase (GGDEF)-like protein